MRPRLFGRYLNVDKLMSSNAPNIPAAPTGSNTVTVACKLPFGMKLEVGRPGEDGYQTHTLKGTRRKGAILDATGQFTLNVLPAAFWRDWMSCTVKDAAGKVVAKGANASLPAVKNGMIYVHEDRASVEAYCADHTQLRTGLEPLKTLKTEKEVGNGLAVLERSS